MTVYFKGAQPRCSTVPEPWFCEVLYNYKKEWETSANCPAWHWFCTACYTAYHRPFLKYLIQGAGLYKLHGSNLIVNWGNDVVWVREEPIDLWSRFHWGARSRIFVLTFFNMAREGVSLGRCIHSPSGLLVQFYQKHFTQSLQNKCFQYYQHDSFVNCMLVRMSHQTKTNV